MMTRLKWAILSTNIFGMPVLCLFIFTVLGITFTSIASDFKRDPSFIPFNFLLLMMNALIFSIIHLYHVLSSMTPAEEYLAWSHEDRESEKRDLAKSALAASEWLPYRTMFWSAIFYLIGPPIAVASIQFAYSFSIMQTFILWVGITTTGMLVSVFQFYTTRKALLDFQAGVLTDFPELLLEERTVEKKSIMEVGIRGKFMGAMVLLATVLVVLMGVVAFSTSLRGLQMQLGSFYLERLNDAAPVVERMVKSGASPRDMEILFDNLFPEKGNIFVMVDHEHRNLLKTPLDPSQKRMVEIIPRGVGWTLELGRPSTHALAKGVYSIVMQHQAYTAAHLEVEGADLFLLVSISRYQESIASMIFMVITVIVVAILLALVYAKFSSEEIRDPLVSIMDSIEAMAKGDLTRNIQVTGQDEIGVLSRSLARAIFNLRRLIGRIGQAAQALDKGAGDIMAQSGEVATGSQTQVEAVDETYNSMEEMNESVQSIADSIQTLASSAQQSSASIIEVQASIEEVANNVDTLASAVEGSSNSILEMNFSIKEVDDNVQDLTKRAGEAMSAVGEMETMIDRVSMSSKETAVISEQVARDAEQGHKAVEMTISGINKIQETSRGVADVITRLGHQAQQIGQIVTVIEDVTEETNLLALNAAIIAAQAGEHGRGFSVVADEIKDLAERTNESTKEIADLIESVQDHALEAVAEVKAGSSSIADGVKLSEQAGHALHQIQESVQRALEQTKTIAETTAVQAEKSKSVMEFMDNVNAMIVQIAQSTQEQAKSGDLIASSAQKMEEIAHQVKRATQEQTQGSRQITQSIEHIAEITHFINNAQTDQIKSTGGVREIVHRIKDVAHNNQNRVEEMTGAVQNLNSLAEDLRGLLSEFKL